MVYMGKILKKIFLKTKSNWLHDIEVLYGLVIILPIFYSMNNLMKVAKPKMLLLLIIQQWLSNQEILFLI
jgi:hypothetical protein